MKKSLFFISFFIISCFISSKGQSIDSTLQSKLSIYQVAELTKLKNLNDSSAITNKEYTVLKNKVLTLNYDYTNNPADRIIKLKSYYDLKLINQEEFSYRKSKAIDGTLKTSELYPSAIYPKAIAFSTDAAQYLLIQPNLSIEYIWNGTAIGLYAGVIIPDQMFTVNPLAKGQYTFPGTAYNGFAFKLYFKWYDKEKPRHYWCTQATYAPEWFNNKYFVDEPVPDEYGVDYTMSEKTIMLGLDILRGYEFGNPNDLHIDFFWGIGIRDKIRDYNITSVSPGAVPLGSGPTYPPYLGSHSVNLILPTPVIGFKLVLNHSIKKKASE